MKKYLLGILLLLCFLPCLLQASKELERIESKRIEMDQYTKIEDTPLFGILEIPSISLKQPIYNKDNQENHVDKNVTLLEETISKQDKNHIIVLASHSGSGIHAYFKNLSQLKKGELIHFLYQKEQISYQLFKKEEVLKNGTITLDIYEFPTIVLITCSKSKENIQEIYYGKQLIST